MTDDTPLLCAGCGEREVDEESEWSEIYCKDCAKSDPLRLDEDWQEDRDEEAYA